MCELHKNDVRCWDNIWGVYETQNEFIKI